MKLIISSHQDLPSQKATCPPPPPPRLVQPTETGSRESGGKASEGPCDAQ